MSKLQSPRGTQDFYGEDAATFRLINDCAWNVSQRFNYQEISTPIFEFTEVFKRSVGETTDIVSKEMYCFADRGGEEITLRPEGTAGIARAFLSNGLTREVPIKWFYTGPMFRYERPQKGRYRQFHQLGVEVLGLSEPWIDVETIALGSMILKELGLENSTQLELNTLGDGESRDRFREMLVDYFSKYKNDLSEDSLVRLQSNPLRILDSKDEGDKKLIENAPQLEEALNETSRTFFENLQRGLCDLGISFTHNDRLVRGLDYYSHTVFEFTTNQLGAQNAVLSGGRYDGLVETMGGPSTPGFGWAAGIERLMLLLDREKYLKKNRPVALVALGAEAERFSTKLAHDLRTQHLNVAQIASGKNLGKLMKKAHKAQASAAVIIGEEEIKVGKLAVKNLDSGEQTEIQAENLSEYLTNTFPSSKA